MEDFDIKSYVNIYTFIRLSLCTFWVFLALAWPLGLASCLVGAHVLPLSFQFLVLPAMTIPSSSRGWLGFGTISLICSEEEASAATVPKCYLTDLQSCGISLCFRAQMSVPSGQGYVEKPVTEL